MPTPVRTAAKFTFAAGNAAGVRRLPLYALGAIVTLLVPRTKKLWVYGCGIGPAEGALPLYRLARERLGDSIRMVWLATTDDELARARDLGLDVVLKTSGLGFWLTLRAQVLVVTHGLGDVNRYAARGGFVVQLWHGVPLKRLHLDAPVAQSASSPLRRAVVRRGYRTVGRQIDLFPVASEPVVGRVVTAFGVARPNVTVTGDPRDDVLLAGDEHTRRATARATLSGAVGSLPAGPVVLYAPTWYDGESDPAAPSDSDWDAIIAWLERVDGMLVLRSHPLGEADYAAGPKRSHRVRTLDSQRVLDLNSVLAAVDHLVTDYSSVAYDYSLTGGTTVYLAADIASYLRTRGLYEPYDEFSGGRHVTTWPDALQQLGELVDGGPALDAARRHAAAVRDQHFDHLDGRATERVLTEIQHRAVGTYEREPAPAQLRPMLRAIEIGSDELRLEFDRAIGSASLEGPRRRVEATVDGASARIPLLVSRWGHDGLALPSGRYRLCFDDTRRVDIDRIQLPTVLRECFRATALADDGGFALDIAAPLTDDERSPRTQLRLRVAAMLPGRATENAVYFESFYGRTTSDNPLGVDRELARTRPEVTRYWSVRDRSVPVPSGAVPIVEHSREWWRVRADARVYVVNDWLLWSHRGRGGQKLLQTWHGTMLKRLAIDRIDHTPRQKLAATRQSQRWDALLAQNDYSAKIFRSAYAYRGPIWQTGYPRNDVLGDDERVATVRAAIGLPDDAYVVLYAPTWRDDRTDLVDYLDLDDFAGALPDDHLLLVRGHSRTLAHGVDQQGSRLIDVTSYPDIAELMLVADILVTDYSSVMFDFASTGKPMVFYVPDFDHYGDKLRGFYFDLVVDAPGPIVQTREELLVAISERDAVTQMYAERYARWREKFTPFDDGEAARRVVQRMTDEGWL